MSYARPNKYKKPAATTETKLPGLLEIGAIWPTKNETIKSVRIPTKLLKALANSKEDSVFFNLCETSPERLEENPNRPAVTVKVASDLLASVGVGIDELRGFQGK